MVDYMQSKFNQAALCVHAMFPDMPLNSEDFFKVFNTESGFQFYANTPQRGLGQLTGEAVRDVLTNRPRPGSLMLNQLRSHLSGEETSAERRAREDVISEDGMREGERQRLSQVRTQLQSLSQVAQCQKYLDIVDRDLRAGLSERTIPACHFISLDKGIDRNLFYSMTYFAGLRQQYTREMEAMMGREPRTVLGQRIDPARFPNCRGSTFEANPTFMLWATYSGYGDGPNAGSMVMRHANCNAATWASYQRGAVPPDYPRANATRNRIQQIEGKYQEILSGLTGERSCF